MQVKNTLNTKQKKVFRKTTLDQTQHMCENMHSKSHCTQKYPSRTEKKTDAGEKYTKHKTKKGFSKNNLRPNSPYV